MLEAAAITKLVYYREEKYDEKTMSRVYQLLREAGATTEIAENAIKVLEDNGILFRERKQL
jgi:DNA-binding transcriptional regulator YhcF (GntR family)